jgi:hypothetical protein
MTQHQLIQLFLPIAILLPVLYFRMRGMSRTQPLKMNRLWIRPAIILGVVALVLLAPQPGHHVVRHFVLQDWVWLALAAALGAVGGWYWGRTMALDVHPEDGTLMVTGGQAAILVLVVLVLLRLGLRTGLEVEGKAMNLDAMLISDASIIFTAALFTVRAAEMYIRARRVMARA